MYHIRSTIISYIHEFIILENEHHKQISIRQVRVFTYHATVPRTMKLSY